MTIGLVTPLNVMVVPGQASATACRNSPGDPLSVLAVTTWLAVQTMKTVGSLPLTNELSSVSLGDSFVPLPSASQLMVP